jgi:hypothetical protein
MAQTALSRDKFISILLPDLWDANEVYNMTQEFFDIQEEQVEEPYVLSGLIPFPHSGLFQRVRESLDADLDSESES